MDNKRTIISLLSLLIALQCFSQSQEMKVIPLKQGYNKNPAFQIDRSTIEPINLFIRPEPQDDSNLLVQLELNISTKGKKQTTFLGIYGTETEQVRYALPKAFGKYLFDLDIRKDGVYMLISRLKSGDVFCMDQREGVSYAVDGLTITYDYNMISEFVTPDNKNCGYEVSLSLLVSDGVSDGNLVFNYDPNNFDIDKDGIKEWEGYKIEVLDFSNLKMKVTKILAN